LIVVRASKDLDDFLPRPPSIHGGQHPRDRGRGETSDGGGDAIDAVPEITGSEDVKMMGACSGGMTITTLLGHLGSLEAREGAGPIVERFLLE
jgi:hypothetical protein